MNYCINNKLNFLFDGEGLILDCELEIFKQLIKISSFSSEEEAIKTSRLLLNQDYEKEFQKYMDYKDKINN